MSSLLSLPPEVRVEIYRALFASISGKICFEGDRCVTNDTGEEQGAAQWQVKHAYSILRVSKIVREEASVVLQDFEPFKLDWSRPTNGNEVYLQSRPLMNYHQDWTFRVDLKDRSYPVPYSATRAIRSLITHIRQPERPLSHLRIELTFSRPSWGMFPTGCMTTLVRECGKIKNWRTVTIAILFCSPKGQLNIPTPFGLHEEIVFQRPAGVSVRDYTRRATVDEERVLDLLAELEFPLGTGEARYICSADAFFAIEVTFRPLNVAKHVPKERMTGKWRNFSSRRFI